MTTPMQKAPTGTKKLSNGTTAIPKYRDWMCKLAYASNASHAVDLLLLPVTIVHRQSSAMVDSRASHNFISTTMLSMLNFTGPDGVPW